MPELLNIPIVGVIFFV